MIVIKFSTDNDAFADDPGAEVARILRHLAERADIGTGDMEIFLAHMNGLPIFDVNGNRVGAVAAR